MSYYVIPGHGGATEGVPKADPPGMVGGARLATWTQRMGAAVIDYGVPAYVWPNVAVGIFGLSLNAALWGLFAIYVANSVIIPARNRQGQSIGKRLLGLKVAYAVRASDGLNYLVPASAGRLFVRLVFHTIDCFILPALRPMWHRHRRTFADSWAGTIVIHAADAQLVSVSGVRCL